MTKRIINKDGSVDKWYTWNELGEYCIGAAINSSENGLLVRSVGPVTDLKNLVMKEGEKMNKIKVTSEIEVYEVDGVETHLGNKVCPILVNSHSIISDYVILDIEGKKYTVSAYELNKAITNATNC